MTRRAARPIRTSRRSPVSFREDGWRALVSPVRIAGLVLMVGSAAAIGWLVTSATFALGPANDGNWELTGLHFTDATAAVNAVALSNVGSNNVFLLHTSDIRRRLLALPSVADVDVHISLPNHLVVAITERTAVLRVAHDGLTYLLDGDGIVLEARAANAPPITDLPLIDDQRVDLGISLEVGQLIDPTESAAMLQIGAITPALLGSQASSLQFSADDGDGFVMTSFNTVGGVDTYGWRAVFGFYTPTLRPPTQIAQQVQCLRSLLATGEAQIQTIYLAPSDDRCGTYLPRPS